MEPDLPAIRAERALLGAALLAPHTVERVGPWVPAACMRQPHHRELWQAMTATGGAAHGEEFPHVVLRTMRGAGRPVEVHGAARLHDYMRACPEPAHAPLYGGMVVEAGLRRTLAYNGEHLQQVARSARPSTIEMDLAEVSATARRVTGLAPYWQAVPEPVRARLDPADPPYPVAWPAEPRLARAHADPAAERAVIAAVLAHPRDALRECGWLTAEDFGRPEHAAAWTAIRDLAATRTPIDAVTVAWQATRHGEAAAPLAAEDLLAWAAEGTLPGAHLGALAVAAGSTLDRVDLAGRRLAALGTADAVPASPLLAAAETTVTRAARDVERLAPHMPDRAISASTRTTTVPAPAVHQAPAPREIEAAAHERASARDGPTPPDPEHDPEYEHEHEYDIEF